MRSESAGLWETRERGGVDKGCNFSKLWGLFGDNRRGAESGLMTEVESEDILCPIAPWYYKRMGLMALMLAGFGLWFLYDGLVGYHKDNHRIDVYEAFQAGREGQSWAEIAAEHSWPVEPDAGDDKLAVVREAYDAAAAGESWSSFSAERRLPEEKGKRHTDKDIEGQMHWAYGAFSLAGLVVLVVLFNVRKVTRADGESFTTPSGKHVLFSDVFRVDKRKWDNKGLAYAYYREESGGDKKVVLDDLKYAGVDRILERLLGKFEGEVIERVAIDEDEEEEGEEESADAESEASSEGEQDEAGDAGEKS